MRRMTLAWALTVALAGAGAASAADHQYFATSVNEDQAVLLDLATRTKVGEVVTLDLIVLSKQPNTATGSPTYWVDGVQEVDCANHRTRIMLVAAYSLDRSRKASSPNAAYRPWTPNGAADTQAIEAFVCRNVRNAGFRPVVDLTAFQRDYFQQGQRLAAAPPNPPSPPPVAPARPQAAPAASPAPSGTARYLVTIYDKDTAFILDRSQIKRSGNIVSALHYKLDVKPKRLGSNDIYWSEATKEYDCAQNRIRYIIQADLTLDRRNRIPFLPPMTTEWEALNKNSDEAENQLLVCTGKLGRSMTASSDDLTALQRAFFSYAASQEPKFAFGPGAAAAPSSGGGAYVLTSYDKASAEIVERRSIKRNGQIASAATWLYKIESSPIGGVVYNWAERTMEIDCGKHLHRRMILGGYTANLSQHFDFPRREFDDWDSNDGKMYGDLEALLCNGRAAPEAPVINALTELPAPFARYARGQDARLALATPVAARAAPAPPVQAQAAPPVKRNPDEASGLDLLLVEETIPVALIVNRNSLTRKGDIADIDSISLNREARTMGGYKVYWDEAVNEVDCRGHRWRTKVTMSHTLEMDHQEQFDQPKFGDWIAIDPSTAHFEAYLCQGTMGKGYRKISDLQSYRRAFFQMPAPPAAKPPVIAKGDYLEGLVAGSGASLVKRSSIKRQADLATYQELAILPEPAKYKDKVVYWIESTWQVDCKAHRSRSRIDAYLSDNRSVRTPETDLKFDPWEATSPKSYAQEVEQYVCLGRRAPDSFKPIDDVEDFRSEFLKALKAGVFKD